MSAPEQRVIAQAFILLPVIGLLVRAAGFRRLKDALTRLAPLAPILADPLPEATMITRLVTAAASRNPVPSTCLSRSLTLWLLLRRHGVDADICLGIRGGTPQFEGHAWVECLGWPLNEHHRVRDHFAVMDVPPKLRSADASRGRCD